MENENTKSIFETENKVKQLNRLFKSNSPFASDISETKRIVNSIGILLLIKLAVELFLHIPKLFYFFRMGLIEYFSTYWQIFIDPIALLVILILLFKNRTLSWYFLVIYLFIKTFQVVIFILSQFTTENSMLIFFTGGLTTEYVLPGLVLYTVILWLLHIESIKTYFKIDTNGKWLSYLVVIGYIFYRFYILNE